MRERKKNEEKKGKKRFFQKYIKREIRDRYVQKKASKS
jgi:hypothetical protein